MPFASSAVAVDDSAAGASRGRGVWALILALEPVFVAAALLWYWLTPEHLEALLLFVPPMLARGVVHRRLWARTPLDVLLLALVVAIYLNYLYAPYARSLWIGGRGILGVLVVLSFAAMARQRGDVDRLVKATLALSGIVAIFALTMSIWSDKSDILRPMIDLIPRISGVAGVRGGFNVNEIAGAMAWLLPVVASIMIHDWRFRLAGTQWRRWSVSLIFALLWVAVFFGQSRMAIFGLIAAMGLLIMALIPAGRWRMIAWAALIALTVAEMVLFIGVFSPDEKLESRDEASLTSRLLIWDSAAQMIVDYPLTGVGMNKYRLSDVRKAYPVAGYENRILPHAHNEVLQIGADLGVPGVLLFVGWHGVAAWMLWRVWRHGEAFQRALAVGLLASLLAHGVFGLGDTIALWDRLSFVFWWILGLVAALYVVSVRQDNALAA